MRNILSAALAAAVLLAVASVNPADARCLRVGHHSSCIRHRLHYVRHTGFRSVAAYRHAHRSYGIGYGYFASSAAGSGSSYSSAATMGPSPRGGGGP